jgi:hypothetical protein
MHSKKPNSNTTRPSWRVCLYHVYSVGLNSSAKIAQAIYETRQQLQESETVEEGHAAAQTLELLLGEKRKHEKIIQERKKTRLENKRAARYKRMGGQGAFFPVWPRSLFDSCVKEADEGMIVRKSGVGYDAAGTPRKKKLPLRKRRLRSGSRDKRTATES